MCTHNLTSASCLSFKKIILDLKIKLGTKENYKILPVGPTCFFFSSLSHIAQKYQADLIQFCGPVNLFIMCTGCPPYPHFYFSLGSWQLYLHGRQS